MLSRVITRSLRSPALRTAPWITSSSTAWNRSMARHNRPAHNNSHTPNNSNNSNQKKQPDPSATPQQGGPSEALKQQAYKNQNRSGRSDQSKIPDGPGKSASSEKSSVPQSESTGGKAESQSEIPPTTEPKSSKPLPDLRHGIPSTLEYEMAGSSPLAAVDLTEADGQEGGGRGKGELPASAYISSSDKKRARAANIMYATFGGVSILGLIYLGRNWENEEEEKKHAADAPSGWALGLMWNRARARLGDQLSYYNEPAFPKLLPDEDPMFSRPYTLVLSMEDLLLHSEWTREHGWRMAKRPGVDYFLRYLSQYYELCLFTTQPWAMAEPIVRKFDPYRIIAWPLYREATYYEKGEYIKVYRFLQLKCASLTK